MRTSQCLPILAVCLAIQWLSLAGGRASNDGPTSDNTPASPQADSVLILPHVINPEQRGNNTLTTRNGSGNWSLEDPRVLSGGEAGAESSTVGEQIRIATRSDGLLNFRFSQCVDLDFGSFYAGDMLRPGQDAARLFAPANPNKGGSFFADEILGPGNWRGPIGLYPSIDHELGGGFPIALNDGRWPIAGDATWAFQWDAAIPVGGASSGGPNKSMLLTSIPEPSTLALITLAFVLLGLAARRRAG